MSAPRRGGAAWPVIGLLLVGVALRLHLLGDQNLWWDEALAVWAVRQPLEAATLWTAGDVHPPLFFWVLWLWMRLAGQSELALRLATAAFGTLSMALAYVLGRRLGGQRAGLLSLALVGLSRFEVWWSTELRMYMLAGMAILAAIYATVRWLEAPGSDPVGARHASPLHRRRLGRSVLSEAGAPALAGVVLAETAALYSIYLSIVAVAALNLAVLGAFAARRIGRERLAAWLGGQLVVAAAFAAWLAVALPRMRSWSSLREASSPAFVAELWATLLATGVSTELWQARGLVLGFWAALVLGATMVAWRGRADLVRVGGSGRRVGLWALALFAVLPPAAVWAATQPRSLFYSPSVEARYLLPFAAPVYVLAAVVLAAAWRSVRPLGVLLVAVAVGTQVLSLPGHYADRRLRDELQSMVLAIWTQAEPGDAVLLVSGNRYPIFRYYYDQPWSAPDDAHYAGIGPRARPPVIEFPDRGTDPIGRDDWQDRLEELLREHPRVWLAEVDRGLQDPDDRVEAWLNDHRPRVLSEGYGANALHLYAANGAPPRVTMHDLLLPYTVEDSPPMGARRGVFGLPTSDLRPGDHVRITYFEGRCCASGETLREYPLTLTLAEGLAHGVVAWSTRLHVENSRDSHLRWSTELEVTDRIPAGWWTLRSNKGGLTRQVAEIRVGGAPPLAEPVEPVDADFGVARLAAAAVAPRRLRGDEPLVVDLYWREVSSTILDEPEPPVVFVHLLGGPRSDSADTLWAAQDGPPSSGSWVIGAERPNASLFDRHLLVLDPEAPAGEYLVEVGLYDPVTGKRHAVTGRDADVAAARVVLGTVEVEQR